PDTLGLAFHGLVLGEVQGRLPSSGTLILLGGHASKVKLAGKYREVRRIVDALRVWTGSPVADAPPVVLNKHCPEPAATKLLLRLGFAAGSFRSSHSRGVA